MSRTVLVLLLLASLSGNASPKMDGVTPQALVPGTNTVLTLKGSDLEKVREVWTSFGGRSKRQTNKANKVVFEVTCPSDACGVGALQVVGPNGISDYQLVYIDALPSQPPTNTHQSITNAQNITPPVAIDGVLKQESVDYYKFRGKARERISIEVVAHRLGSQMDPVALVLDLRGNELAFCDDEGGTSRDSRLEFTCPLDSEYILAVHDVGYGGGNNFKYRLRVGDFPLIWHPYPLEPIKGVTPEVFGVGTVGADFCVEKEAQEGLLEMETNNSIQQAQEVSVPIVLNGKFQYSGDKDIYKFKAEKGEKWIFAGTTRSLGSPADLRMNVLKGDGSVVKTGEISGASEGKLTNNFNESGQYYLEVSELSGAAGANLPYQIEVQEGIAGFSLSAETDKIELSPGGEGRLKIACARWGYDGPIALRFSPMPSGISVEKNIIPEKKNDFEIKLKLSASATPGEFAHFKIIGTMEGKVNGFSTEVSTAPALKKAFPLILYPNKKLDGLFSFAVKEQ